mmetsp:Transcript_77738/g.227915  ORF Transcript_77738/g.227915 Transcript_77738/m.227915 type:complete len:94 (+) Transcript_77738:1053-1334(+)
MGRAWLATASVTMLVQQSLKGTKAGGSREIRVPIRMHLDTEVLGPNYSCVARLPSDESLARLRDVCRWLAGLARHLTAMVALLVEDLLEVLKG